MEGTNAMITNAGMSAKWWVCASVFWVAMYNGYQLGKDGLMPWQRRYNVPAPYKLYPWGSLVFVKPPKQLEPAGKKSESKMVPHLIVAIGLGPGMIWNHTYGVIKLTKLIGENRPSRAMIRYTTDIMFPDIPSFPLKIKLNSFGAL